MIVWIQTKTLFKSEHILNTFRACFLMAGIFFTSSGLYLWTPDILNKIIQFKNESMTTCAALNLAYQTK